MMFPEYPDALDAKQVCEMLGTSTKTLYKMIDEGHITPVKVGRKYVFAKVKIVEFLPWQIAGYIEKTVVQCVADKRYTIPRKER